MEVTQRARLLQLWFAMFAMFAIPLVGKRLTMTGLANDNARLLCAVITRLTHVTYRSGHH